MQLLDLLQRELSPALLQMGRITSNYADIVPLRGLCTKSRMVTKLPSSFEEGRTEAAAEARVVLVNRIILLTNTTPALRATPPQLRRRGAFPHETHFLCKVS